MLYCFMFYLYMNFSGYCDVVIAGASLVGLKTARKLQRALPGSQHSGLLVALAYHFGPLDTRLSVHAVLQGGRRAIPSHATAVAVIGYFVAFTIAGIWHGSTWNFLVYGLLHGAAPRRPSSGRTRS